MKGYLNFIILFFFSIKKFRIMFPCEQHIKLSAQVGTISNNCNQT